MEAPFSYSDSSAEGVPITSALTPVYLPTPGSAAVLPPPLLPQAQRLKIMQIARTVAAVFFMSFLLFFL
jgi:hypothetical protein